MSVKRKNDKEVVKRLYRGEKAIRNFVAGNSIMINCLDFIQTILKNEKYKEKQCPFDQEIALNLDKVEILAKKGTLRDKTVDFVVCLEKDWLLLVEAKLEVENVANIGKTIQDKIEHSKVLLRLCDNYIHSEESVVVLLNNKHYQEQSNKLRKLLIAKNVNIKPYRVCDFYKEYFMPIC